MKAWRILPVLFIGCISCRSIEGVDDSALRVYGGEKVARGDERFQAVHELRSVAGSCTGTFITPTKMFTAAHCVENSGDGGIIAINPRTPVPTSVTDQGIRGKPQAEKTFGRPDGYKDFVVLNFASATAAPTLPVCTSEPKEGDPVYMVGYGFDEKGNVGTKKFAEVEITAIDADNSVIIIDGEKSVLPGDSGGPLVSVEGKCVFGIASYMQQFPQGTFRSVYVNLLSNNVKKFLNSGDLSPADGGSDSDNIRLQGFLCSATSDVIRRLEFSNATELSDITSVGPVKRKYEIVGDVLTVYIRGGSLERYKIGNSGGKLVPSRNNADVRHFSCVGASDRNDEPSVSGSDDRLRGKKFKNQEGYSLKFVDETQVSIDESSEYLNYSVSGSTLSIGTSRGASSKYLIENNNGITILISESEPDSPYTCTNCR
jgi:hypothetical protein